MVIHLVSLSNQCGWSLTREMLYRGCEYQCRRGDEAGAKVQLSKHPRGGYRVRIAPRFCISLSSHHRCLRSGISDSSTIAICPLDQSNAEIITSKRSSAGGTR